MDLHVFQRLHFLAAFVIDPLIPRGLDVSAEDGAQPVVRVALDEVVSRGLPPLSLQLNRTAVRTGRNVAQRGHQSLPALGFHKLLRFAFGKELLVPVDKFREVLGQRRIKIYFRWRLRTVQTNA